MEFIERPKKVPKGQKNYLSEQSYQDSVNKQLDTIYNKIDEIIRTINS